MNTHQRVLLDYVEDGSTKNRKDLTDVLNTNKLWTVLKEPMVVYRGQLVEHDEPTRVHGGFFSTTTSQTEARDTFAGTTGCVWELRLQPGIRIVDVEAVLGEFYPKYHKTEKEILVESGKHIEIVTKECRPPLNKVATYSAEAPRAAAAAAPPPIRVGTAEKEEVTIEELRAKATPLGSPFSPLTDEQLVAMFLGPNQRLVKTKTKGGRRSRTKKGRRARKATRRGRKARS